MTRPRVKICGVTRVEDAALAVALGADAIGLNFWDRSPRCLSLETARAVCQALPPFVTRVGVFVNAAPQDVRTVVDAVGLDAVQLHGDERVEEYGGLGARLIRVVTLEDEAALAAGASLPAAVTVLVDAVDRERRGGTGHVANWRLAAVLARRRPMILAGGLTPENVAGAVREVQPWAVDVSSGVERAPGLKSADKLRAFFAALATVPAEENA